MPPTFIPFSDHVLIRRHEVNSSGPHNHFSIPDAAKDKPQEGTVIAVGPGQVSETGVRTPVQCAPGDHVFVGKFAGTEININGERLLILLESEILGTLKGDSLG